MKNLLKLRNKAVARVTGIETAKKGKAKSGTPGGYGNSRGKGKSGGKQSLRQREALDQFHWLVSEANSYLKQAEGMTKQHEHLEKHKAQLKKVADALQKFVQSARK